MNGSESNDEVDRLKNIDTCINTIYNSAIYIVNNSIDKKYNYEVCDKFIIANIDEIINGLRYYFSGCSVKHVIMAKDKYGELYDISALSDNDLLKVDCALNNSYISIDWS